jgi:ABC-type glycerol-3-phosphate transport system substrate-binding protein
VLIKNDHGPGGLLDLLKSASPVAPGILPDVIALDTTDLETAARLGLIQPIDSLLPADVSADLFPAARDLATHDGKLYGVVVSADLEHLAYNTKVMAASPAQWSDILTSTRPVVYVFSLHDGSGVSDSVLAHYFALGGQVVDTNGRPTLDQPALLALLNLYQQAQRRNILPANVLELDDSTQVWNTFRSSGAAIVDVQASRYMSIVLDSPSIQFAPLPAVDQSIAPIARGWALALVTHDPHRQAPAIRLMQRLASPLNNGAWTQSARTLPGRISALAQWDQSDPYTGFVHDQLARAQAAPPASITNVIGPVMRKAIDDVLSGHATPEEAAQLAVMTVGAGKAP